MNPREAGFLLLGSCLGDPARRPLTPPQLQRLAARVRLHPIPGADEEELTPAHLFKLGCSHSEAEHIVSLLSETDRLSAYLDRAGALGLQCLTRANPRYPRRLMRALGDRAPSVLWFDGNLDLLQRTGLSLVGSRELRPENRAFAQAAGLQMARQGYVLVSGGARGADAAAQASCLTGGGQVIAVLAGPLTGASHRNLLLCCEDSFDLLLACQSPVPKPADSHPGRKNSGGASCLRLRRNLGRGYRESATWVESGFLLYRRFSRRQGASGARRHRGYHLAVNRFFLLATGTNRVFLTIHGLRNRFFPGRVKKFR